MNNNNIPLTIFTTPTPFWCMPQEVRYHMCRPMAAFVASIPDESLHAYLRGERALVGTFDLLACCVARAKSATAQDHVNLVTQVLIGYRRIFTFLVATEEEDEENNNNNNKTTPGGSVLYSEIYMRLALELCLVTGACPTNTSELNSKAFQLLCEIMVIATPSPSSSSSSSSKITRNNNSNNTNSSARLPPSHCSMVLVKLSHVVTMLEKEQDAAAAFGALLYCLAGCGTSVDTDCWAKCVRTIRDAHLNSLLQVSGRTQGTAASIATSTPPPSSPATKVLSGASQQQGIDDIQIQKRKARLEALAGILIPRWHSACREFASGLVECFTKLASTSSTEILVDITSITWCDTRVASARSLTSFLPSMNVTWTARTFALILSFFSPADQIYIGFVPGKIQRDQRRKYNSSLTMPLSCVLAEDSGLDARSTTLDQNNNNNNNNGIDDSAHNVTKNSEFDVVDDFDPDEDEDDGMVLLDPSYPTDPTQAQRFGEKQTRQQQRLRFATSAAAAYSEVASILSKTQLDASTALLWLGNPVVKAVKLLIQHPPALPISTQSQQQQQQQQVEATKKLASDAFDFAMTSLEAITTLGRRIEASSHHQTIANWSLLTEQAVINAQWCLQIFNTSNHTNFATSNNINNNNNKPENASGATARRSGGGATSFFESSTSSGNNPKSSNSAKNEEEERAKWMQNQKLLAAAAAVIAARRRNSTSPSAATSLFAQAPPPNLPAADQTTRFLLNFENMALDLKNTITRNQIYRNVLLEFIPVILGSSFPNNNSNNQDIHQDQNKISPGLHSAFPLAMTTSLAAFNLEDSANFGSMSFSNLGATFSGGLNHNTGLFSGTNHNDNFNSNHNNNNVSKSAGGALTNNNTNTNNSSIGAFAIYNIPDKTWSAICHHLCVAAAANLWTSWDVTFAQLAQHITATVTSPTLCRKAGIITSAAAAILHARCSHEPVNAGSSSSPSGKVTMARHMTMITNAVLGEVREKLSLISQISTSSSIGATANNNNANTTSSTANNNANSNNNNAAAGSNTNNNNLNQQPNAAAASTPSSSSSPTENSNDKGNNNTSASNNNNNNNNNTNPSILILRGILSVMHSIFLFPWDHLYFDGNDRHRKSENNNSIATSYSPSEREHVNDKKAAQLLMNCVATLGSLADAVSSNINDQEMLHPRFGPGAPLNEHTFNLFFQQQQQQQQKKGEFSQDPALFFATSSATTCNLNNVGLNNNNNNNNTNTTNATAKTYSPSGSASNSSSTSLLLMLYYWIIRLSGRISALIVNLQEKQESASTREKESTTIEYIFKKKRQCTEICTRIANHAAALPLSKDTYQVRMAGLELYFQVMMGFRHFSQLPLTAMATSNAKMNNSHLKNKVASFDYFPDEFEVAHKAARMIVLSVGADRIVSLIQLKHRMQGGDSDSDDENNTNNEQEHVKSAFRHSELATIVVIVRSAFGRCAFKFKRVAPVWATLGQFDSATTSSSDATADSENNSNCSTNKMIVIADGDVSRRKENNNNNELMAKLQASQQQASSSPTITSPTKQSVSSAATNINMMTSANVQDPLFNGMSGSDIASNNQPESEESVLTSRQRKLLELKEQQRQEAAATSVTSSSSSSNADNNNNNNNSKNELANSLLHQLLFGRPPLPELSASSSSLQHAPVQDRFPLLRILAREFTQQAASNGLSSLANYNEQLVAATGAAGENNNNNNNNVTTSVPGPNTAGNTNTSSAGPTAQGTATTTAGAAPSNNSTNVATTVASPTSLSPSSPSSLTIPAAGWKLLAFNAALASRLKGLDRTLNTLPELNVAVFDETDPAAIADDERALFTRFFDALGTPSMNSDKRKMGNLAEDVVEFKSERRGACINFVRQNNVIQLAGTEQSHQSDGRTYQIEIYFRATTTTSASMTTKPSTGSAKSNDAATNRIYTKIYVVPLPHSDKYSVVVDGGDAARISERTSFVLTPASCSRTIHDLCFLHVAECISPVQLMMRREALRRVIEVSEPFRQGAPFDATSTNIVCELLRQNEF